MTLEFRTAVGGELKDIDEPKREVFVSFPHDVRDSYDTTFGSDCFRESFEHRMPAIVWQHNMAEPIGRTVSAQVTSRANELVGKFSDFDAVPLARRAFSQLQDGSLTDASFGFQRQKDERHPEMRGVTRITKAVMQEWSPVTIGAIPGAVVTGTRADTNDKDGIAIPTLDEIMQLQAAGVLDREEVRAMIAKLPEWREHIILFPSAGGGQPDPDDPAGAGVATSSTPTSATVTVTVPVELVADEKRDAPMVPAASTDDSSDDDSDDAATLAASVDAALDSAVWWFAKMSPEQISQLPSEVQQGIALVQAAGVVVDDLLEVMGVVDADDPDDSDRAAGAETVETETSDTATEAREDPETERRALTVSTAAWDPKPADYTLAQWKNACLIWDGPDDQVGSGKLPVKEPDGTPNKAAMAAAAGRLAQVDAPDAAKQAAAKALLSLYGQAKLKAPGSLLQAARAIENDPEVRALVDAADLAAAAEVLDDVEAMFAKLKVA
jgi:HK97 family phage prohead protease